MNLNAEGCYYRLIIANATFCIYKICSLTLNVVIVQYYSDGFIVFRELYYIYKKLSVNFCCFRFV